MGYEATIIGCYVCWSKTLGDLYAAHFDARDRTIVKIGRSTHIMDRIRNHQGLESDTSRGRWATDKDGYAHVNDWQLWRLTTNLDGLTLEGRELYLQSRHSPITPWLWRKLHRQISHRAFVPQCDELYIAKVETLVRDFPMIVDPSLEVNRLAAKELA